MKRKKAEELIKLIEKTRFIILNDKDFTPEEKVNARISYLALTALRTSLHRFTIDKRKKLNRVKISGV
jgi:hypothetical protein